MATAPLGRNDVLVRNADDIGGQPRVRPAVTETNLPAGRDGILLERSGQTPPLVDRGGALAPDEEAATDGVFSGTTRRIGDDRSGTGHLLPETNPGRQGGTGWPRQP